MLASKATDFVCGPVFPLQSFFAFCFVLFCLSLLSSKETDVNFESTFTLDNHISVGLTLGEET